MLHVTRSKNPAMSSYFMHNQKMESVDSAKYLGVRIRKDLSWNTHISNITTCANRALGCVKRNAITKESKLWHITLLSVHSSSMPQQSGALTQKKILVKLKKFKEGQPLGIK